jgi:hypothetical protein
MLAISTTIGLFAEWNLGAIEAFAARLGNWIGLAILATVVIAVTFYVMKPNKKDNASPPPER